MSSNNDTMKVYPFLPGDEQVTGCNSSSLDKFSITVKGSTIQFTSQSSAVRLIQTVKDFMRELNGRTVDSTYVRHSIYRHVGMAVIRFH